MEGIRLADFGAANTETELCATVRQRVINERGDLTKWGLPPQGVIKANTDATWLKDLKKRIVGMDRMVATNDRWTFQGAYCKKLLIVNSAIQAEAMAIREGMEFAKGKNWHRLEFGTREGLATIGAYA
ncbi:hypothetical protein LIER_20604 [Lithospermum erythrorhizon]|uniref:RNase H type-1 domain-containing protein n=1 Tax=Lithospermum erythrorhizon TaxID=34254 RepID=A0AAV3QQ74_LITER